MRNDEKAHFLCLRGWSDLCHDYTSFRTLVNLWLVLNVGMEKLFYVQRIAGENGTPTEAATISSIGTIRFSSFTSF